LLAPFGEKPNEVTPKHSCCDNCAINCSCGLDGCKDSLKLDLTQTVEHPGHSQMTRPVTAENKLDLVTALKKFRKDEVGCVVSSVCVVPVEVAKASKEEKLKLLDACSASEANKEIICREVRAVFFNGHNDKYQLLNSRTINTSGFFKR